MKTLEFNQFKVFVVSNKIAFNFLDIIENCLYFVINFQIKCLSLQVQLYLETYSSILMIENEHETIC